MTTSPAVFDQHIDQWRSEQAQPWYRLMRRQMRANLANHLAGRNLRILDAGGGNGLDSLPLAALGHHVTIVDYAQEMLADAQAHVEANGLQERVRLQQADLASPAHLLEGETFDVALCHNVIQYLDDAPGMLRQLSASLKPGGLLSLVSMNRYSAVYAAAFLHGDLIAAKEQIGACTARTILFDAPLTVYSVPEAAAMLAEAGFVVVADYGLLCITAYWGDNERKRDPTVYAQLEALELALTDKEPYKHLARSFQVIAQK